MKRSVLMLMAVVVCCLSARCQTTVPVFSTTFELFRATVKSVYDAKAILIKHGLATEGSCEITDSEYSDSAKILRSVTHNENFGTIIVEVTYDKREYASKLYAVSFMIMKHYANIFNIYLSKNNYKLIGERPDFPWTRYYTGKYTCSVTDMPDGGLSIMFVR